jgi:hypothetical protein
LRNPNAQRTFDLLVEVVQEAKHIGRGVIDGVECEHGDFKSTVNDDLAANAKAVVGRPATPVGYAGVARRSSVGGCAPEVGVTPRVGVGAPGVGLAPGSLGGPVNRVGVRQMGGDMPLTAVVSTNSQESLIMSMKQKLIAFHHWSMAVIGALVLSKVVLVLEHVSLGAWVGSTRLDGCGSANRPLLIWVGSRTDP